MYHQSLFTGGLSLCIPVLAKGAHSGGFISGTFFSSSAAFVISSCASASYIVGIFYLLINLFYCFKILNPTRYARQYLFSRPPPFPPPPPAPPLFKLKKKNN